MHSNQRIVVVQAHTGRAASSKQRAAANRKSWPEDDGVGIEKRYPFIREENQANSTQQSQRASARPRIPLNHYHTRND